MDNDPKPTNLDSSIIKPRRSYACTNCKRLCPRSEVGKTTLGTYYCRVCGGVVVDVTDTTTGHDFLEIVGI